MNNMPGVYVKRHDDFKASYNGLTVLCSVVQLTLLVHCFMDFNKVKARISKDSCSIVCDYPIVADGLTDPEAIAARLQAKSTKQLQTAKKKYSASIDMLTDLVSCIRLKHEMLVDRFVPALEAFNNEIKDLPFETKKIEFQLPEGISVNNKYFNGNSKDPTYLEPDIVVVKKKEWPFYMMNFLMVVKGSERVVKEKKQAPVEVDLDDATAGLDACKLDADEDMEDADADNHSSISFDNHSSISFESVTRPDAPSSEQRRAEAKQRRQAKEDQQRQEDQRRREEADQRLRAELAQRRREAEEDQRRRAELEQQRRDAEEEHQRRIEMERQQAEQLAAALERQRATEQRAAAAERRAAIKERVAQKKLIGRSKKKASSPKHASRGIEPQAILHSEPSPPTKPSEPTVPPKEAIMGDERQHIKRYGTHLIYHQLST